MISIVLAVVAHGMNALVFVVDKGILGTGGGIGRPVMYAAYSGLVAAGAGVVLFVPRAFAWPNTFIVSWSLLLGVAWVLALWLFFRALKAGEPSRIVPIAGASVPLFTWIFAAVFLGERLSLSDSLAVLLLVVGGVLLSIRFKGTRGVPLRAASAAVLSGVAFAAYFAGADYVYDLFDPFLAAFAYTRIGAGLVALALLGVVVLIPPRPRRRRGHPSLQSGGQAFERRRKLVAVAFVGSKLLAAGALLLQNWAIDVGSVTVVNALQGTQYVAVLALAAGVSVWWPKVFREELSRVALWQKVGGIVLVSGGVGMLVV